MNVYRASDYAGLEAGNMKFYYGYERTTCPIHGADREACCEAYTWAFVAWKNGVEVMRLSSSALHKEYRDPEVMLMLGIARYGDKFWKDQND
jgi:hypothetical protein